MKRPPFTYPISWFSDSVVDTIALLHPKSQQLDRVCTAREHERREVDAPSTIATEVAVDWLSAACVLVNVHLWCAVDGYVFHWDGEINGEPVCLVSPGSTISWAEQSIQSPRRHATALAMAFDTDIRHLWKFNADCSAVACSLDWRHSGRVRISK